MSAVESDSLVDQQQASAFAFRTLYLVKANKQQACSGHRVVLGIGAGSTVSISLQLNKVYSGHIQNG